MPGRSGNVSQLFVSFQGEGLHVGRCHLFVRFGGCPLRCRYCDQPESLSPVPLCSIATADGARTRPNPLDVAALDEEVVRVAAGAPALHAIALTGGEPLAQAEFIARWLAARTVRLPVLLETAGVLPDRLTRLLPLVDIVSLDVKCPTTTGERARWDEHRACFAAAAASGRDVYGKMPVDEDTPVDEVEQGARIVAESAPGVPLFLTPLTTPTGTALTITGATLGRLHAAASRHHPDVRVLPQVHKILGVA